MTGRQFSALYIDESVSPDRRFVIAATILSPGLLESEVNRILRIHGFQPGVDEFKSSLNFKKEPCWQSVREALVHLLHSQHCAIAVAIASTGEQKRLGNIVVAALTQISALNALELDGAEIFFDQDIRRDEEDLRRVLQSSMLRACEVRFGCDSRMTSGIQAADLVAGSIRTVLTEELAGNPRTARHDAPGDLLDGAEYMISEEILMNLAWLFFADPLPPVSEDVPPLVYTGVPRSVWISPALDQTVREAVHRRLGSLWHGCGH